MSAAVMTSAPITIGTPSRLPTLERALLTAGDLAEPFHAGIVDGLGGWSRPASDIVADYRARHGFATVDVPLLTPPDRNAKLAKASRPSYGLTLAHANLSGTHNGCAWAGDCVKVCVVANGNGAYPSVQRAWQYRTALLVDHPVEISHRIGWEIGQAIRTVGPILWRPNVNSDVDFGRIWNLETLNPRQIVAYGYSKNPKIIGAGPSFHGVQIAYSLSERTKASAEDLADHLATGGRLAVVTSRRYGNPIVRSALLSAIGIGRTRAIIANADLTDEWIIRRHRHGIIGDLSAKGRARSLIGRSDFVKVAS